MIIKSTQRGGFAEIATHLLREDENEEVELIEIRGAVARDLHGALAEWDFQRAALTKARNGFYCVAINPDHRQRAFTEEDARNYLAHIEPDLGLSGQPRALVRHVKDGREHWHAVYSRIDTENARAIHMSFDHLRIEARTIEYAREHGFELPDGYFRESGHKSYNVADRAAQEETGIGHEEHVAAITEAWQISDSPAAFLKALEERGYLLATGKRPYVIVDIYGKPRALTRMIDDRQVRTKDVEKFLGGAYPAHELPTVEQAQALVAEFAKTHETLAAEHAQAELDHLAKKQHEHPRRKDLQAKMDALAARQEKERDLLAERQQTRRENHQAAFRARENFIRTERERRRPRGLADFLGRISGINYIRAKLHERDDHRRQREFEIKQQRLERAQAKQREELKQRQILEKRPLEREMRAIKRTENEEYRKLKRRLKGDLRRSERTADNSMPAIVRERRAPAGKGELSIAHNTASGIRTKTREKGDLTGEFTRAADRSDERGDGGGNHAGPDKAGPDKPGPGKPKRPRRPREKRRTNRDRDDGPDRGR